MINDKALAPATAEVQVTIVTTVTVPTTAEGHWLHSDAITAAANQAMAGFGHYEAREVGKTGAPGLIDEPVPADVDQVTRDLAALGSDAALDEASAIRLTLTRRDN